MFAEGGGAGTAQRLAWRSGWLCGVGARSTLGRPALRIADTEKVLARAATPRRWSLAPPRWEHSARLLETQMPGRTPNRGTHITGPGSRNLHVKQGLWVMATESSLENTCLEQGHRMINTLGTPFQRKVSTSAPAKVIAVANEQNHCFIGSPLSPLPGHYRLCR